MHIPNGFSSDPVCAITTIASAAALGAGLWRVRRSLDTRACQSLAAASAAIFAAQMLNFPIDHGTSGHLVGAAVAAIALGPWTAMIAMAVVLAIQATLFGDGSMSTLGANLLSMAVVAPWIAWGVYRLARRGSDSQRAVIAGSALAGLASILAAASVCSCELAAAGKAALDVVLPAMLKAHLLVGVSEGLLTAGLVAILSGYMDLTGKWTGLAGNGHLVGSGGLTSDLRETAPGAGGRPSARAPLAILGLSAAVALLLAPRASSAPDALESVAERLGFADLATTSFAALAPDYALAGLSNTPLSVGLAGMLGVAAVFAVGYAIGRSATSRLTKQ